MLKTSKVTNWDKARVGVIGKGIVLCCIPIHDGLGAMCRDACDQGSGVRCLTIRSKKSLSDQRFFSRLQTRLQRPKVNLQIIVGCVNAFAWKIRYQSVGKMVRGKTDDSMSIGER